MPLQPGAAAPDFTLPDQDRNPVSLAKSTGTRRLLVFMPFPFTRVCEGELCTIRDNLHALSSRDVEVLVVTCGMTSTNKRWASEQGFTFPILSDFWPHGEVTRAYDCFNEAIGVPERATFTIDESGIVRAVVVSESLGTERDFAEYTNSLDRMSG